MRSRARELRRTATVSEQRLWNWLRKRTIGRFKFRRQVPIGRYVVDFYCAELRLVFEIDGHQHETAAVSETDNDRTLHLRARGIEVVRIANEVIAKDPLSVEVVIKAAIDARLREL
jgi:very-short-patch-repair endonuclease